MIDWGSWLRLLIGLASVVTLLITVLALLAVVRERGRVQSQRHEHVRSRLVEQMLATAVAAIPAVVFITGLARRPIPDATLGIVAAVLELAAASYLVFRFPAIRHDLRLLLRGAAGVTGVVFVAGFTGLLFLGGSN